MTEHYGDDLYTEPPADLDSSYDTALDGDTGAEAPLWETDPVDGQTLDASPDAADPAAADPLDVPPAPDLPDYTDPLTDPVTGEPADPWVQDQADAAADDPYAAPGDAAEDPYAPADPYDPNVGLDPTDPSYDHYYAEHGHPYDGPSDYDPNTYTPSEYPYRDPFAQPDYDPSHNPYTDPGYNPYADGGPYSGDYDVVYDPCWGDVGYDPYNGVFVQVDVTVGGDVYVVGDQAADVYVVDEGDPYGDSPTTTPDHPEPPAGADDGPYTGDHAPDAAAPYESYGPMDVTHYTPEWTPADFDGVGDPLGDAAYYHGVQDLTNSPLATEGQIIEKLTGQPFNEAALAAEAQSAGFFDPMYGMDGGSVGSLLELHGIETETIYDANMDTLLNALESGDPVMAVVDTNETGLPLHDVVTGAPVEQNPPALSSVWVTGVDVQPDGSVYVLVNDPSWPEGQTMPVEVSDFANAWEDGGNQAVIAHQPV